MSFKNWKGKRALVTGASSGLGVGFARHLAEAGADLVLVARRAPALETLAAELRSRWGVAVETLPMDLTAPGAVEALAARALPIDILINNAGFGLFGPAEEIPLARELNLLDLDIRVPLELTRRLGEAMLARREGWILQVASLGGFQPTPLYATYSAAKAFILNWGEALSYEWRPKGVRVTVLSPGITATEFLQVSGQRATFYQRTVMMGSSAVVRTGLKALQAGRASVVPGLANRMTVFLTRLLPRTWIASIAHALMR